MTPVRIHLYNETSTLKCHNKTVNVQQTASLTNKANTVTDCIVGMLTKYVCIIHKGPYSSSSSSELKSSIMTSQCDCDDGLVVFRLLLLFDAAWFILWGEQCWIVHCTYTSMYVQQIRMHMHTRMHARMHTPKFWRVHSSMCGWRRGIKSIISSIITLQPPIQ